MKFIVEKRRIIISIFLGTGILVSFFWIMLVVGINFFVKSGDKGDPKTHEQSALRYEEGLNVFYQQERSNTLSKKNNQISDEYKCFGSCRCEDSRRSDSRRSGVTILRSGIFYGVSAFSSILAFNKAKEFFKNECEKKFHDTCHPPSIISSYVDECESNESNESLETSSSSSSSSDEANVKDELSNFTAYCTGNCVSVTLEEQLRLLKYNMQLNKVRHRKQRKLLQQISRDYVYEKFIDDYGEMFTELYNHQLNNARCNEITHKETIVLDDPDMINDFLSNSRWNRKGKGLEEINLEVARYHFLTMLNNECVTNGIRLLDEISSGGIHPDVSHSLLFCQAWHGKVAEDVSFDFDYNPSVKCVRQS